MKSRLVLRLYPTPAQERACEHVLFVTRRLWNALVGQRRDAWKTRRLNIGSRRQYHQLTELRKEDQWFASVYRECEDAVLHRLDLAYRKFFSGGGHPRFKAASRWNQFEFPHGDRALRWNAGQDRITIPGVGRVRVRKGRARLIPPYGRAMVYRRGRKWYALFECEVEPKPKARLNHAMLDASLAMLRTLVGEKAGSAARLVIDVPAAYSSQTCSACGNVAAEARNGERYHCVHPDCGYAGDADVNAARVIAQRAFARPAGRGAGLPDLDDLRSELPPGDTRLTRQEVA